MTIFAELADNGLYSCIRVVGVTITNLWDKDEHRIDYRILWHLFLLANLS